MQKALYVGLDVHKASISVSTVEDGREGAVNFVGTVPNTPIALNKLSKRLARDGHRLESGCCGYGVYRQLTGLRHGCTVVATSVIPRKPANGSRPTGVRDLTRTRMHRCSSCRLGGNCKHFYCVTAAITRPARLDPRHRSWLAGQTFDESAHQIAFQAYLEAVWTAQDRRDQRISTMAAHWSMGPLVEALRGLRGLDFICSATFVAAIGDLGRFENARQLISYLGFVPSEQSSGERIWRGGITKTGNGEARRMLIEAAWSYRYPPRVAKDKAEIVVRLPKIVREVPPSAASAAADALACRQRQPAPRGTTSRSPVEASPAHGSCRRSRPAASAEDRPVRCPVVPWVASYSLSMRPKESRFAIRRNRKNEIAGFWALEPKKLAISNLAPLQKLTPAQWIRRFFTDDKLECSGNLALATMSRVAPVSAGLCDPRSRCRQCLLAINIDELDLIRLAGLEPDQRVRLSKSPIA